MKKMTNLKKNALNAAAAVLILTSITFAQGDMGGGGFAASNEPVKIGDTRTLDGDMGGGGLTPLIEEPTFLDEMIVTVAEYLGSVF